jgi:hypothetical protein
MYSVGQPKIQHLATGNTADGSQSAVELIEASGGARNLFKRLLRRP